MDQKTSYPPSGSPEMPSADKMSDTLKEQDLSKAPGSNRDNDGVEEEGLWQFAMKLPKPNKQARWYAFMCLACGWICPGSHSISHLRSHLVHSEDCEEGCPKVTQNILDRLKAIDETKDVPTWETLAHLFKNRKNRKNRKRMSESVSSSPDTQLESLLPIGDANSPCLGTPAKKMKPQLEPSQAPMMSSYPDADLERLYQMVKVLQSETGALARKISTSVVPETEARNFFLERVSALKEVALDLQSFVLNKVKHNC